jgi:hypothetical protein
VGIEAVRAIVDLLDPEQSKQIRNALSELQMLYARQAEGAPAGEPEPSAEEQAAPRQGEEGAARKPPPGLWTPPGSS